MCGQCDQMQLMDEAEAKSRVIKVVSLWQPWAEAMRRKLKTNETRSWFSGHRGWLGIHAAKKRFNPNDYGSPRCYGTPKRSKPPTVRNWKPKILPCNRVTV